MGLDVYLRYCDDFPRHIELSKEGDDLHNKLWAERAKGRNFNDIPEEERRQIWAEMDELMAEQGFDRYGDPVEPAVENIEIESAQHPGHLFKIGYFRSSYNEGGINRVLETAIGKTLYYIFQPGEEYEFLPDWEACLERAREVRSEFAASLLDGTFGVAHFENNAFGTGGRKLPEDQADALAIFKEELARKKASDFKGFDSYSNALGTFFFGEMVMRVRAVIPGFYNLLKKQESVYVIYEADHMGSYMDSLDIVIETIQWVLDNPRPGQYRLAWSA